jgi:hypothetical protein
LNAERGITRGLNAPGVAELSICCPYVVDYDAMAFGHGVASGGIVQVLNNARFALPYAKEGWKAV